MIAPSIAWALVVGGCAVFLAFLVGYSLGFEHGHLEGQRTKSRRDW